MTVADSRIYHEHVKVYSEAREPIGNATFVGKGVQTWSRGGRGVLEFRAFGVGTVRS